MEWLFDYNDFLLGINWIFNNDVQWVFIFFTIVLAIYIKIASGYSWRKLLMMYVVKYISYYTVYVVGIDGFISDTVTRVLVASSIILLYLFSSITIKLLWLNIFFFNRDEFLHDLKSLWKALKYLFSKMKSRAKNNQNTTASTTSQKESSKQEAKQESKEAIRTQVQTEEPKTKNIIVPNATEMKINNNGKKIYTDKGYVYFLQKKIAQGGEGSVYILTNRLLAKLYSENHATTEKLSKIQTLIAMKKFSGVVFPEKILYDEDKNFIGFSMPQIFGVKELGVLHIPSNRAKYCPHWTYIDLLDLSITLANTLKKLHKEKIIVADFNPRNVLVKSPKKVYFIDIDSYQIQRKPSTVGMKIYTRPMHFKKSHREYLKNQGDDIYALSVIIFQNLMSGANPYEKIGISNENELLELHEFSFDVYEPQKSNVSNALINAWSNLSIDLRKFFEDVFRYQKPVLISTLTQALLAHKRTLMRVQTKTRRK
jgi:tRNA A-37 threonylcarbamoyl transferase component Bud32